MSVARARRPAIQLAELEAGISDGHRRRAVCNDRAVPVVRVAGLDISYERRGRGPPLVFVHGAGDDGHLSNLEQPKQFNDAVRDFCRDHARPNAR